MPRKKKKSSSNNGTNAEHSEKISNWHKNVPILYDSLYQEKLTCPSYACVFGHLLSSQNGFQKYRLFQSHATNANYLKDKHVWQGLPHALLICNVYLPDSGNNEEPHANETLYQQMMDWDNKFQTNKPEIVSYPESNSAQQPYIETVKRLIHPGPILRIRQMPGAYKQMYVFCWNTATQHHREMINNSDPNTPELILKGHKKDAVYALDFSHTNYGVASGSKDTRICIWNIADHQTTLACTTEPDEKDRFVPLSRPSPKLKPRMILAGHESEVNDVEFAPYSPYILSSVSSDKSFKLWDTRCNQTSSGEIVEIYNKNDANTTHEVDNNAVVTFANLHNTEITNLSWNKYHSHYILTAATDGTVKLLDIRKLQQPTASTASSLSTNYKNYILNEWNAHSKRISSLSWNPSKENSHYFLSASHDGTVNIYDIRRNQMIFQHIGHMNYRSGSEVIHSASWMQDANSWCIASTSSPKAFVPFFWSSSSDKKGAQNKNNKMDTDADDNDNANPNDVKEGGIMQIWKPSLLLKMSHQEILQHLKKNKGKKFINDVESKKKKKRKKANESEQNEEDVEMQMND